MAMRGMCGWSRLRLAWLVALPVLLSVGADRLAAQSAPRLRHALVSMVGPRLQITHELPETGSHLDTNRQGVAPLTEARLDQAVLATAHKVLTQRLAGNAVDKLFVVAPDNGQEHQRLTVGDTLVLPQAVVDDVAREGVDRIVLIAPLRSEARLQAKSSYLGQGRIGGIGLYVNVTQDMRRVDTGEIHRGFVAPYVYLNVVLLDARSMRVLASHPVHASATRLWMPRKPDQANASTQLTDVATPEHVRALLRLLDKSVATAVAGVISASPATAASAPR